MVGRIECRQALGRTEEGSQRDQIVADAVAGDRGIGDVRLCGVVGEAGEGGPHIRPRERGHRDARTFVVDVEVAEIPPGVTIAVAYADLQRSEEHTSELQSLMRNW